MHRAGWWLVAPSTDFPYVHDVFLRVLVSNSFRFRKIQGHSHGGVWLKRGQSVKTVLNQMVVMSSLVIGLTEFNDLYFHLTTTYMPAMGPGYFTGLVGQ